MANVPAQMRGLVAVLPQLDRAQLDLLFLAASDVEHDPADFEAAMDATGLLAPQREAAVSAAKFLLGRASKIPVDKLAPRLQPIGFTLEHLKSLEGVLARAAAAAAAEVAAAVPEPEPADEAIDFERIAVEMIESDDEGGDYTAADDAADDADQHGGAEDADANPYESEFPDRNPAEALLSAKHQSLTVFMRATVNHILGNDFTSSELDRIDGIAYKSKMSPRTLHGLLRLINTTLREALSAQAPADILVAKTLAAAHVRLAASAGAVLPTDDPSPEDTALPEGVPPDTSAIDPADKGHLLLLALNGISHSVAKRFCDAARQLQQIAVPKQASGAADGSDAAVGGANGTTGDADEGVDYSGWLLAETGTDRDIAKRSWQQRWLVISPGKLDIYFSPEATSEEDRICSMPLDFVYVQRQPKTPRVQAPYAFRLGVKDVTKVDGEAVNKLILNPKTKDAKDTWMKRLLRAKMEDTDLVGELGFEVEGHRKWRRFDSRWFVAAAGRLEMYKNEEAVNAGDFTSIIPLESCEIVEHPKTKRQDAPFAFRITVNPAAKVINKPIRKLVLNPITERNKKEWLQALHLCSLAMMPEEVKSKTVYESESETESEYESDEYEYEEMYDSTPFDKHGRPRGDPNFGKAKKVANDEAPFDEFGRKRGDPLFGKPHGYVETDDSDDGSYDGSGVDSDNSDDSESDEDDSSEEEEEPRKLMEGWLDTDATGKQKKWVKSHKRWFVLRVGSLYMYSSDKSADAGKHLSVIPLRMCNVRAPKSKRKEQPYAFRIDVTSWKRVEGEPVSKLILDPGTEEIHEAWLNTIALASDPSEPNQEPLPLGKVATEVVTASAQEFDALQVVSRDQSVDEELEVVVRTTVCGVAILDGNDKSLLLGYYPNSAFLRADESSTNGGKTKTCNLKFRRSRTYSTSSELAFVLKTPKLLVDAVNANFEARSPSDVCTDPVVNSYFNTNESKRVCAYLKGDLDLVAQEESVVKSDAPASDAIATNALQKLGKKMRAKGWDPCSVLLNEAVFTWFKTVEHEDGSTEEVQAGCVRTGNISDVIWPTFGEGSERIRCFQILCNQSQGRLLFSAPTKRHARVWVAAIRSLISTA